MSAESLSIVIGLCVSCILLLVLVLSTGLYPKILKGGFQEFARLRVEKFWPGHVHFLPDHTHFLIELRTLLQLNCRQSGSS